MSHPNFVSAQGDQTVYGTGRNGSNEEETDDPSHSDHSDLMNSHPLKNPENFTETLRPPRLKPGRGRDPQLCAWIFIVATVQGTVMGDYLPGKRAVMSEH